MAGTVVITGANGSLALPAVAYLLNNYPSFTLLLTVRDDGEQDPNTAKLRRLIAEHPNADATIRKLDLNALEDVRTFSDALLADIGSGSQPHISAVICNAMTWNLSGGPKYSKDGYETSIAINHLAHFSLTLRLLGGMDSARGRVVFLGSIAHWPEKAGFSKGYPTHVPENMELMVHPHSDPPKEEMGRGFQRYGTSKLATVLTMYELNRRLKASQDTESIRAVMVDPLDLVDSRAFSQPHVPFFVRILLTMLNWLLPLLRLGNKRFVRVEQAAKAVVDVAVADEYAGREGYFEGADKVSSSPDSQDVGLQKALWAKSVEWCELKRGDTVIDMGGEE